MSKREAVIVAGVRTAVGKAPRGSLRTKRPDDLAADVLKGLLERVPQLDPAEIEDVIMGCAMPEGEQGLNIGRVAVMRAGLPHSVAGITVNRFCSSGLQTIAMAAQAIEFGSADVVIAGGVESMSMVPMTGHYFAPNPHLALHYPEAFISMGLTAEKVAEKYGISREEQDEFAYRSHQLAIKAIDEGKFKDEIVPVEVEEVSVTPDGERVVRTKVFDTDEGPRRDTSLEALARLRPVFRADGTVTAGNSSQTSDGAAAVLLMTREKAEELGLKPIARVVSFSVGGVPPEIMGIGPVAAVPKALKRAGLTMDDIDLIELNEAFAAQSLAVIRQLEMPLEKVNVNGGAIALGHPLGCTGAKLTVQIINELRRRKARYGLVTMCIGGGMGAAGVIENLDL
ncbi:MAG: acetyl-CoA C-acyltransferase [Ardenticatenia bacterium]|uniref:acetyl-CoA C-acyltransferase n=1 Tax=Ardenticatena maritima TaxID=872965 RepID=A0A0P6YWB4_9CHLR|nr:acetyl-CoA C-acyltransferase [Ardenticatena maritima]KPL89446.1 acetyl-CoA acetyltransferase [Ardenticatena maritima]RME11660.1 MAG: acetyl-CoA C-acyltransferase [Ardenticatenia bacterium]